MQYQLINALFWLLAIIVFWFAYYWLYRDYALDSFRQKMFAVRDDLFDFAAEGNISFDHPAYTILRTTMNGYVRFGHRLRLLDVLLFWMLVPNKIIKKIEKQSFKKQYEESIKDLDENTRKHIEHYRLKMTSIVISYSSRTSFPVLVMMCILFVFSFFIGTIHGKVVTGMKKFIDSKADTLDSTAMHEGLQVCTSSYAIAVPAPKTACFSERNRRFFLALVGFQGPAWEVR